MEIFIVLKKKILKTLIRYFFDKIDLDKEYDKSYFRNKNYKNYKYYIIASKKKRGFFSLVLFVLNHLKFAQKKSLIPIIDMEIHKTLYNEKNVIFNTNNAWEYYFKKINSLKVKNIYKKKNFMICKDENIYTKNNKFHPSLKKIFIKNFKIHKRIASKIKLLEKKYFSKKGEILGIHFRGTDMKYMPNHPMPATKGQIFRKIIFLKKKYNFKNFFLITEDLDNYQFMKKKFGDQLIDIGNFRSNSSKIFDKSFRRNHRYMMGEEALINGYLLSKCKVVVSTQTGISDFSFFLNNKIKFIKIKNGNNSPKILFSIIKWEIKNILPEYLGGFK